jgi:FdhD protein
MKKEPAAYYPLMSNAGLSPTYPVPVFNESGELKEAEIAGELPLTIFVDGHEVVTLMTLGTHPEQLVLGYLRNQKLIEELEIIESVQVDWAKESAQVKTFGGQTGALLQGKLAGRTVTTGCGQGTIFSCAIEGLYETKIKPMALRPETVNRILKELRRHNQIYKAAGAVHGCALCSKEHVEIFVEDVGRHNAADAIAGKMWLEGISGQDKIFYCTGRLTSEIVIKAALMETPVLVSRSGITHMGLELAQDIGITMIARAKGGKFLVFNGHEHFIHDA